MTRQIKKWGRLLILIFFFQGAPGFFCPEISATPIEPVMEIKGQKNRISIIMANVNLNDFIIYAWEASGIQIDGLDPRKEETVSFRIENTSVEHAFKSLLKHLGETSYAFEFRGDTLCRVSVVTESKQTSDPPHFMNDDMEPSLDPEATGVSPFFQHPSVSEMFNRRLSDESEAEEEAALPMPPAVRVTNIINTSQAEKAGLREGDIIHVYDGVMIENPRMLVEEVQNKVNKDRVTMTVIRDGEPFNVELEGGQIGIHISSAFIPE